MSYVANGVAALFNYLGDDGVIPYAVVEVATETLFGIFAHEGAACHLAFGRSLGDHETAETLLVCAGIILLAGISEVEVIAEGEVVDTVRANLLGAGIGSGIKLVLEDAVGVVEEGSGVLAVNVEEAAHLLGILVVDHLQDSAAAEENGLAVVTEVGDGEGGVGATGHFAGPLGAALLALNAPDNSLFATGARSRHDNAGSGLAGDVTGYVKVVVTDAGASVVSRDGEVTNLNGCTGLEVGHVVDGAYALGLVEEEVAEVYVAGVVGAHAGHCPLCGYLCTVAGNGYVLDVLTGLLVEESQEDVVVLGVVAEADDDILVGDGSGAAGEVTAGEETCGLGGKFVECPTSVDTGLGPLGGHFQLGGCILSKRSRYHSGSCGKE